MMIYWPLTPVTLTHILLGIFRWSRTVYSIVASYERLTVIIPVYDEQEEITATLRAILNQTEPPDQIIISDNGSQDETCLVIEKFLMANRYALRRIIDQYDPELRIGQYEKDSAPTIVFMQHRHQTSKADSINKIHWKDSKSYPEYRFISSRAAIAWQALKENEYTRLCYDLIRREAINYQFGFYTGIYEENHQLNSSFSVNTSGIILESLWFKKRGKKPLIYPEETEVSEIEEDIIYRSKNIITDFYSYILEKLKVKPEKNLY